MPEHFAYKEIKEGAEAVRKTLAENKTVVEKIVEELERRNVKKGFIIGSGTSFHASLALNYLLTKYTDYHFTAIQASEFEDWTPLVTSDYVIIGFSQSGESSDIIRAIEVAREKGVFVIGITNTPGSTLTKISDVALVTRAGEEKAVVATKTYDSQLAIGSLLALSLSKYEETSSLLTQLEKIPETLNEIIKHEKYFKEIAEKYKESEHIFILGRGINYANALEAGLKFKEAAMIHSEGFAVREFLHGPIQLVDENTPVIIYVPTEYSLKQSEKTINKLKSYNARVIAVTGENLKIDFAQEIIRIPSVHEDLSAIPVIKPIQFLAYFISIARGYNPDKPTKLTKVVKYEESRK